MFVNQAISEQLGAKGGCLNQNLLARKGGLLAQMGPWAVMPIQLECIIKHPHACKEGSGGHSFEECSTFLFSIDEHPAVKAY